MFQPLAAFVTTRLGRQEGTQTGKPELRNGIIAGGVGMVAIFGQGGRAGEDGRVVEIDDEGAVLGGLAA